MSQCSIWSLCNGLHCKTSESTLTTSMWVFVQKVANGHRSVVMATGQLLWPQVSCYGHRSVVMATGQLLQFWTQFLNALCIAQYRCILILFLFNETFALMTLFFPTEIIYIYFTFIFTFVLPLFCLLVYLSVLFYTHFLDSLLFIINFLQHKLLVPPFTFNLLCVVPGPAPDSAFSIFFFCVHFTPD